MSEVLRMVEAEGDGKFCITFPGYGHAMETKLIEEDKRGCC